MTRRILEAFGLTAAYFLAGRAGLLLAFANESTSPVWPPAGIAVAALLIFGPGVWPVIAAGAFLVNMTTNEMLVPSIGIAAGNTLEALAGWWLVTRFAGGVSAFTRAGTVFRFAALGGIVAPIIAATIGTASLWTAGLAVTDELQGVWLTWWLGDGVGIVLVTPLLIMWTRRSGPPPSFAHAAETLAVMLAVAASAWLVFGDSPAGSRQYPLPYVAMPVLLWPAFRLGPRETVTAMLLLSVIAVIGTAQQHGPFVRPTLNESLLFLLLFIGLWTVTVLAVAVEVQTRERVESDVRGLNQTLEARVNERTEELQRTRDRLVEAQRVASVGSWEWDIKANTIWWSDELYRIFAVEPTADLSYERYLTLLYPEDRPLVEGAVGKSLADLRPFSLEHRLQRSDGSIRIIQADGHVVLDDTGAAARMVGTGRDITALRQAEEDRVQRIREQAARLEAEDANRAKDEFLATLSHELRTPLNAALGWAQMLRDVIDDPAARQKALSAILRNLHTQARLVSDMMDLSHMTLRTLRLEQAPVNMADVIRAAIESVRVPAASRAIAITAAVPDTPVHVLGDDGRLQQVVCNLLSNSAKFSEEGTTVKVTLLAGEGRVALVVEDEGQGIEPTFLPHVFDRFRQADSSVTRQHGGLGLGLAIARHLVEAHGGVIEAANRPGGGAVFTVWLPAAPANVVA